MTAAPSAQPGTQAASGYLFSGDCLRWLERIASSGGPRFELVYVDPPFNAGGSRGVRQGRGNRAEGAIAYEDHWGGLESFLTMLEPRLAAIRNVMAPKSSLWVHLDHRAVHDTKVLLDSLFGRDQFEGEVIWVPGNGARRKRGPSVTHQTILIYSHSGTIIWNAQDPSLREPFAETSRKMHFTHVDSEGRRYRERVINAKAYRYYEDEGRRLGSVWLDCGAMRANTPLVTEATGYPTQKPESLLERIIRAGSTSRGWILDPMCGSGTTIAVAARLGRPFCGIDASELAYRVASKRLLSQGTQALSKLDPLGPR